MEQKAAEKADENHDKANDRKPHKRHAASLLSQDNGGYLTLFYMNFLPVWD
ncbi:MULTISPECIES: hypothetical protein [Bacillus]|uniref:hypothetical protein n=1 Tax=Bacillus TaxID=1386 RepID=UPI0030F7A6CF